MNKIISIFVSVTVLAGILCVPLSTKAVEVSTTSLEEFIQLLKQQIEALRVKILELQEDLVSLKDAKKEVKEVTKEIKETIRINKRLWRGMSNEDVRLLQEILATDPEIYPEGLITGYFGPLTERAVKRFQKKMGVEQVGLVGPKTLAKINELLTEGAGSSGKVPPGLLIAPGIQKKISFVPQPLPGQELPPGIAKKLEVDEVATSTPDITSPVISEISATSTIATSTRVTWVTDEEADSKVWYSTSTQFVITTSTLMVSSSALVTNHDLTLSDLTATTTYYYMVSSSDGEGNAATSSEQSLTTLSE